MPSTVDFVWLFVAHMAKWPPAVEYMRMEWIDAQGNSDTGNQAGRIVRALREAVAQLDGQPLQDLHDGMSGGRMSCTTGNCVAASCPVTSGGAMFHMI